MSLLKSINLSFSYGKRLVLKNINLTFESSEVVGIIGPNGAGKSTLLSLFQGLLFPSQGQILLADKPLISYSRLEIAKKITLVPQFSNLLFPFTVMEVVLMGRHPFQGLFSFEDKNDIKIAETSLKLTDATIFRNRLFNELSGGEKQRVIIARALAQTTQIILLDEPTSSLDIKHQKFIYELLRSLAKNEQKTIIIVSHDINLAALYSDRLILIKNGEMVKEGTLNEILDEQLLREVYETELSIESSKIGPPFVRLLPGSNNAKILQL